MYHSQSTTNIFISLSHGNVNRPGNPKFKPQDKVNAHANIKEG